nr:MAG TPA: hypothetical protein [Caudoviricetes sp.]DAL20079.1 MAG TPA_asm: hypothetical protein [Caudoviricetes sp.]
MRGEDEGQRSIFHVPRGTLIIESEVYEFEKKY